MSQGFSFFGASAALLLGSFFASSPVIGDSPSADALLGLEPALVVDLETAPLEISSRPREFFHDADLGITFFAATSPANGTELWSYDGNEARQVVDLCPGACSSEPRMIMSYGGQTLLTADDGVFGRELWSTDGTPEGTIRLGDVCPGPCSGFDLQTRAALFEDRAVFTTKTAELRDGPTWELWSTDGTPSETSYFSDLPRCDRQPSFLLAGTNTLYWDCDFKLFASRGSDQEIVEVFDQGVLLYGGGHVLEDEIFVRRFTEEHGAELWKSDGTPEGSGLVADFGPGSAYGIRELQGAFDGFVYFTVDPSGHLYRANSETFQRATFLDVERAAIAEDRIYYSRNYFEPVLGEWRTELRTTQGLPNTEELLLDQVGFRGFLLRGETAGGNLFFQTEDELWFSDGSPAGTRFVANVSDIFIEYASTSPENVVFSASQGQGLELWESDATESGTRQVADLVGMTPGSGDPSKMTPVGDRLVFTQDGFEVWTTDGTPSGLMRIEDGPQRVLQFFPHEVGAEPRLFYSSFAPGLGSGNTGLWSTDGVETELLIEDLDTVRQASSLPNGKFVLEARGDTGVEVDVELWATDLTESGTEFLAEASPGYGGGVIGPVQLWASVGEMKGLKNLQIFSAKERGGEPRIYQGLELWASDGTPDGTKALETCLGLDCPMPEGLTRVRKHFVVFSAFDVNKGRELWRTNGTVNGTKRIKDLLSGPEGGDPHDFARIRPARVLFFARNENGGESLWRTTGSPGGTRRIVDLSIDGRPTFVLDSKLVGRQLFFVAADALTGDELWATDGTAAGTRLIRELSEGPQGSAVGNLTAYGDSLLFTARDAESGLELWMSDGTAEGTIRLTDLAPGPASSAPDSIVVVGDAVYFRGDDGETGRELWVLKP